MRKNSEKIELLKSFDKTQEKYKNLDFKFIVTIFLSMLIIFMLTFPKIYITNHIYYTSRDINKLLDEYKALKEENRLLKQKLEKIKYKNQVLDTMF
ncbi:hypothetical protein [Nitrosophilus kaiyonis]|uniref:hypothetical protein n=1 Tax=Nitrosophilus kaiyonis TaxID=2930200 RepID=UPI002490BA33|nr:hypothetical protein [Nitrosophilus kaiyonis]